MTYEELSPEMKAEFDALMQAGETHRALALLNPPKPLTPEEQEEVDRKLAKMEKSNKRFSTFITVAFILISCYLVWDNLIR